MTVLNYHTHPENVYIDYVSKILIKKFKKHRDSVPSIWRCQCDDSFGRHHVPVFAHVAFGGQHARGLG